MSPFRFLIPGTDEHSRWEGILVRNVLLWWRPQSHRTPPSFGNLKEHTPHQQRNPVQQEKSIRKVLSGFSSPQPPPHLFYLPAGDFPGPELDSLSPSPPESLVSPGVLCSPQVKVEPPCTVARVAHCSSAWPRGRVKAEIQLALCSLSPSRAARTASLLVILMRVPQQASCHSVGRDEKGGRGCEPSQLLRISAHRHSEMFPLERLEMDGCAFIITG